MCRNPSFGKVRTSIEISREKSVALFKARQHFCK